jgi:spermidine synthase
MGSIQNNQQSVYGAIVRGSLAKFCYRHLPHTRITVVESESRVIALRNAFYIPNDDHRFRIVHDEGARYLGTSTLCAL